MPIKLSIIYVNYRSSLELQKSISSLGDISKHPKTEIIVVANDREEIKSEEINNFKLIKNAKNLGFAQACNLGAKEAQGEILWFLNPDTEVISGDLSKLLEEFNQASIGIIGPKLITAENNIQPWCAGFFPSITSLFRNNLGFSRDAKIWNSPEKIPTDWVSGTSLFAKNEIFRKAGGFDEKYFMYFEDIDLCKRIQAIGFKTIYYPQFVVKHYGGKSFSDNQLQKKYYYASQDYYFKKHRGNITAKAVRILRKLVH